MSCGYEKCRRAFTIAEILSMPPLVPGREAYYCCWGVFPTGFVEEGGNGNGFTKCMPPMFRDGVAAEPVQVHAFVPMRMGRPRKNL